MSTQSGITASNQLIQTFKEFVTSNSKALFISIENENLVPKELIRGSNDESQDISEIQSYLSESKVTYLVVKKPETKTTSYYFISYVPDPAPVREKMLYASSKNTLLRELGLEYFTSVLFVNDSDELSIEGWEKIKQTESASKPLSESEQELLKVKELEITEGASSKRRGLVSVSSGSSTSGGGLLKFKISDDKLSSIINSRSISANEIYTVLIDPQTESFYLAPSSPSKLSNIPEIPSLLLTSEPNYNILNYKSLNYFIYSCPSGSTVKSRMAYAANKQSLINEFTSNGFQFKKIIEVGDSDEIELSVFDAELASSHDSTSTKPSATATNGGLKFSKPKGPRRR